MTKVDFSFPV